MATTNNITVDDRNLTNALRALSKVTGASFREVIRFETGKIMEAAVKKTRAAQVQLIQKNVRSAPVRTLPNGKTYRMSWKMPDSIWAAIQKQISSSIKRRREGRGLSKKSWKQVAASLGITISVPAYVSKATTGGKDYPANATARENKSGNQFFISGKNERTYDPTIVKAIRSAMGARLSYFRRNLKNGVFKTARETAARYPGLR